MTTINDSNINKPMDDIELLEKLRFVKFKYKGHRKQSEDAIWPCFMLKSTKELKRVETHSIFPKETISHEITRDFLDKVITKRSTNFVFHDCNVNIPVCILIGSGTPNNERLVFEFCDTNIYPFSYPYIGAFVQKYDFTEDLQRIFKTLHTFLAYSCRKRMFPEEVTEQETGGYSPPNEGMVMKPWDSNTLDPFNSTPETSLLTRRLYPEGTIERMAHSDESMEKTIDVSKSTSESVITDKSTDVMVNSNESTDGFMHSNECSDGMSDMLSRSDASSDGLLSENGGTAIVSAEKNIVLGRVPKRYNKRYGNSSKCIHPKGISTLSSKSMGYRKQRVTGRKRNSVLGADGSEAEKLSTKPSCHDKRRKITPQTKDSEEPLKDDNHHDMEFSESSFYDEKTDNEISFDVQQDTVSEGRSDQSFVAKDNNADAIATATSNEDSGFFLFENESSTNVNLEKTVSDDLKIRMDSTTAADKRLTRMEAHNAAVKFINDMTTHVEIHIQESPLENFLFHDSLTSGIDFHEHAQLEEEQVVKVSSVVVSSIDPVSVTGTQGTESQPTEGQQLGTLLNSELLNVQTTKDSSAQGTESAMSEAEFVDPSSTTALSTGSQVGNNELQGSESYQSECQGAHEGQVPSPMEQNTIATIAGMEDILPTDGLDSNLQDSQKSVFQRPTIISMIEQGPSAPLRFRGSDADRLRACLESVSYRPGGVVFDSDLSKSSFSTNMETILSFLASNFLGQSHCQDKGHSKSALYLCGIPGVGKTAGVEKCCIEIQTLCENEGRQKPVVCYMNAADLGQQRKPAPLLLRELGSHLGLSDDPSYKRIKSRLKKRSLILVIDEIDVLVSSEGSTSELLIKTAASLAHNPSTNMVLIGISNCMIGPTYERIIELGNFGSPVMFKPYTVHELNRIFESRVDSTLFAKDVLKKVAESVISRGEDTRYALEYLTIAIRQCLDEMKDDKTTTTGPLILMKHFARAQLTKSEKLRDRINGLPMLGKCVLCILATLAKDVCLSVPFRNLKRYVYWCMQEANRVGDMLSPEDFVILVETLVDTKLLNATTTKLSLEHNHNIALGIQSQEVIEILDQDLNKSFFNDMRDRATKDKEKLLEVDGVEMM